MYTSLYISVCTIVLLALTPAVANAATPTSTQSGPTPSCAIIYGGGAVDCAKISQAVPQPTKTPVVTPSTQNTVPAKPVQQQATTKGGLPVHPPTQTKTTPSTGPEAWSLISLLPMAGAGIWLKKRT